MTQPLARCGAVTNWSLTGHQGGAAVAHKLGFTVVEVRFATPLRLDVL